jgi:hypothetical protein
MKTKERHTDKRGRVLRRAERRRGLVAAFRDSGKTQAEFCRVRELNATTFNGWLRQARLKPPRLAEVEVPVGPLAGIEIELAHGVRVHLPAQGPIERAAELIRRIAAC